MSPPKVQEAVAWVPADILEWQDLDAPERFLDLKGYALASDRVTRTQQHRILPEALRIAA
jgi:hypothetical protein